MSPGVIINNVFKPCFLSLTSMFLLKNYIIISWTFHSFGRVFLCILGHVKGTTYFNKYQFGLKNLIMKNTECLRLSISSMALMGIWLPKDIKEWRHKVFFFLYAGFVQIILYFGIMVTELIHLFFVRDDIEKTADCCILLLTHLAQLAKTMAIVGRQGRIKKLMDLLEKPIFNREEPEKKAILESTANLAYMVSKTLALATVGVGLLWGVYPLLKPTLTLPLSYPFLNSESTMFMILYVYQVSGIVFSALADTAEDFLAGGMMVLASAQLDVLIYELNIIGNSSSSIQDASSEEDREDNDYNDVVACVKYHQNIISFVKELNSIFGAPVFCQFAATGLINCLTAFKITRSTEPTEITTLILYLICIQSELLLYCYSGDIISHKSVLVAHAAYNNNWANTSLRTQRALMLLTLRSQRLLCINAGKMFNLSLSTFTAILKSSYSYFAVLNR